MPRPRPVLDLPALALGALLSACGAPPPPAALRLFELQAGAPLPPAGSGQFEHAFVAAEPYDHSFEYPVAWTLSVPDSPLGGRARALTRADQPGLVGLVVAMDADPAAEPAARADAAAAALLGDACALATQKAVTINKMAGLRRGYTCALPGGPAQVDAAFVDAGAFQLVAMMGGEAGALARQRPDLDRLISSLRPGKMQVYFGGTPQPSPSAPGQAPGVPEQSDALLQSYLQSNRDREQQPLRVIAEMELLPGQTIADVGAGSGYFSYHFSKAVGPEGRVLAVDIDANALRFLSDRLGSEPPPHPNVAVHPSRADDVKLPEDSVDHAFLCEAHFFLQDKPATWSCLKSLYRAVRPGGRVSVIEARAAEENRGEVRAEDIQAAFEAVGFRYLERHDFIEREYFLIFEKPAAP
jgi:arsenite methyltransferase